MSKTLPEGEGLTVRSRSNHLAGMKRVGSGKNNSINSGSGQQFVEAIDKLHPTVAAEL